MGSKRGQGPGDGRARRLSAAALDGFDEDPRGVAAQAVVEEAVQDVQAPAPVVEGAHGGVDPGKLGCASLIYPDGSVVSRPIPMIDDKTYDLVGTLALAREWKRIGVAHVMVEQQQPTRMPRGPDALKRANNAVRAAFATGYGFALWEVVLLAADVPYRLVLPGVWKRKMGILAPSTIKNADERAKAGKRIAIEVCQRLYPSAELRRNPGHHASKPNDGVAESILLARYGQLHAV